MTPLKLNIGNKLTLLLVGLSLIVITTMTYVFFVQFDAALKERVLLQLSSVKSLKILKIKKELEGKIDDFNLEKHQVFNDHSFKDSLFQVFITVEHLPDTVHGVATAGWLKSLDNMDKPTLIDITPDVKEEVITLALIERLDSIYVLAISEVPEIQNILLERTGLGETGESYIVGTDYKMRSLSRFILGDPRKIDVHTLGVQRALSGIDDSDLFPDYREIEVFSSFGLIEVNGLQWVLLSEMDHQEALFPLAQLQNDLIFIIFVIIFIVVVISFLLSKMIVKPIKSMEKKLITMSKGNIEEFSPKAPRYDEIGSMFDALQKLITALKDTIIFADKIGQGNFDASYISRSENDKLGAALLRMRDRLKEFQDNEQRLIKENQRSILSGEEQERSRISKEMHDGLGPLLTILRMELQGSSMDHQAKKKLLERIDETINEVRWISNNLMPSVLKDFGVGEAIGNLIHQINQNGKIELLYKNDMNPDSQVDQEIHTALYRISQEALNNALKHANASQIKMSLTQFTDHIGFFMSDNGGGFDVNQNSKGNGLRNIKERVKLANGTFEIESGKDGTSIAIEIPTT